MSVGFNKDFRVAWIWPSGNPCWCNKYTWANLGVDWDGDNLEHLRGTIGCAYAGEAE